MSVTTRKQRGRNLWVVFVNGRGVGEACRSEEGFVPGAWIGKVEADGFRVVRRLDAQASLQEAAAVVAGYVSRHVEAAR